MQWWALSAAPQRVSTCPAGDSEIDVTSDSEIYKDVDKIVGRLSKYLFGDLYRIKSIQNPVEN